MTITVPMLDQPGIRGVTIGFQNHQGYFTFGTEVAFNASKKRFLQLHLLSRLRGKKKKNEEKRLTCNELVAFSFIFNEYPFLGCRPRNKKPPYMPNDTYSG